MNVQQLERRQRRLAHPADEVVVQSSIELPDQHAGIGLGLRVVQVAAQRKDQGKVGV